MDEPRTFMLTCIVIGVLLIAMTMGGSFVARLPLSAAMLYLVAGWGIGPAGLDLIQLHPLHDAALLERLTEIAVLISLFTAGLKLEMPLADRRWRIPVQLASVSMLVTIGAVTLAGVYLLKLPLGAAVLLGAILAPTDPVLASDVQVEEASDRDRLRFGLTGEGGLNDGAAFPFVMLGLGLLSLHDLGAWGWRWWAVDVLWAIVGGLAIGWLLGLGVGRAIIFLRTHHREALGADEFIALGLIALAYGVALACHSYGFLAVFAAGLALRRINEPRPEVAAASTSAAAAPGAVGEGAVADVALADAEALSVAALDPGPNPQGSHPAITPAQAPVVMMLAVERFNAQLERFAEVFIVLAIGALLMRVEWRPELLWFVPLLFLVIRPAAVWIGLRGTQVRGKQRALMGWFGIRGIGSIYYLMYVISHGLEPRLAQTMLSFTIGVVVASIVAHGISVTPLMKRYRSRAEASRKATRPAAR
ncbi:MAG: cation:proton antiporter [Burkholderiaceae bacterium]